MWYHSQKVYMMKFKIGLISGVILKMLPLNKLNHGWTLLVLQRKILKNHGMLGVISGTTDGMKFIIIST